MSSCTKSTKQLPPDNDHIPIHYENGKPVYRKCIKGRPVAWCSECKIWSCTHSSGTHDHIGENKRVTITASDDSETSNVGNKRQKTELCCSLDNESDNDEDDDKDDNTDDPKQPSESDIWKAKYYGLMQTIRRNNENDFERIKEEKEALFQKTKLLRWRLRYKTLEQELVDQSEYRNRMNNESSEIEFEIETKPEEHYAAPAIPISSSREEVTPRAKSEPEEKKDKEQEAQMRIKVEPVETSSMHQVAERKQEGGVLSVKDSSLSHPSYTPEQTEFLKRELPRFRSHVEAPWKENQQKLRRELASERVRNEDLSREIKYWKAWVNQKGGEGFDKVRAYVRGNEHRSQSL